MEHAYAAFLVDLQKIKSTAPVVLNLTNFIAMDLNANALSALEEAI